MEGGGTLAEVAHRHGVPEQALVGWYRRDNWPAARNRWREKQLGDNEGPARPQPYEQNPANTTQADGGGIGRLERQLEMVDDMIDIERDPAKLDKLASARNRLFDQWRILSGIPTPGCPPSAS